MRKYGIGATHTPLHPWLGVNIKFPINVIEKDILHSIGIHLISGTMIANFHETLTKIKLTPKIPDFVLRSRLLLNRKAVYNV